ncbi:MAG: hypothetical protein C0498_12830 [Anaerolinea sp.]|nr:hypothetical protein [Anaerolinea sp.]
MSPRRSGRTAACDRADATVRFRHAESFLIVADLVQAQVDDPLLALTSVAASLAVLAGIAAADAACCAALGRRARGQSHDDAIALVRTVEPDGEAMARDLGRLIALKDDAHYGVLVVSPERARSAVSWARRLVAAAGEVVATAA